MDLSQLHAATGISRRKLRYVLDHRLVPGLDIEIVPDEVGRPRKFAVDVGLAIVSAATLLELGLSHEIIRRFLGGLLHINLGGRGQPEIALAKIIEHRFSARAYFGDGVNVRMAVEDMSWDSKWIAPGNPAPLAADYRPTVEIVLDLGQLLARICPTEPSD